MDNQSKNTSVDQKKGHGQNGLTKSSKQILEITPNNSKTKSDKQGFEITRNSSKTWIIRFPDWFVRLIQWRRRS